MFKTFIHTSQKSRVNTSRFVPVRRAVTLSPLRPHRYAVVSPCAPLLRVSPDLASTPVAQLTSSSGIIYTADHSKAFCRAVSAGAEGTVKNSPTPPQPTAGCSSLATAASAMPATVSSGLSKSAKSPSELQVLPSPYEREHEHPLVVSGRRVWVISPVVGWASVWAETGQKILKPAIAGSDVGVGEEKQDAGVEGGAEKMKALGKVK